LNKFNISTVFTAWINRLILGVLSLYSIRIVGINLSAEICAIYFIAISLTGWFNLSDFGVGASIQNYISECRASKISFEKYQNSLNQIVIIMIIITIMIIYSISNVIVDLAFGKFQEININYKNSVLIYIAISICLTNIFGVINKVLYAIDLGFISNLGSITGGLFSLILLILIDNLHIDKSELKNYIILIYGPTLIITAIIFLKYNKFNLYLIKNFDKHTIIKILNRSKYFFLIGLFQSFIINLDFIIAANYLMPIDIIIYGILYKLFGFTAFFYTSIYGVLWPKFTEYLTKNYWEKVIHLMYSAIIFSIILIISFSFIFQLLKESIINHLMSINKVDIKFELIILMCFYHIIISCVHGFGVVLQSISNLKSLLIWMPMQAIISIFLQIIFVQKYGISGIIIALSLSFLLTLFWVLPLNIYKIRYTNVA